MTLSTDTNPSDLLGKKPGPRILIVGAGAVGQTYGHHLSRGGADVTFLVKEKYRAQVEAGFLLHQHRPLRDPRSFYYDNFRVLSDVKKVGKHRWDQVWLCISSTALRGDWLSELCAQIGHATLVSLQPGLEDLERVAQVYDPAKIIAGSIAFIAYQSPLPGEQLRPGVAYLLAPMAPSPFAPLHLSATPTPSDADRRCEAVVEALNKGGFSATVDPNTPQLLAFAGALLNPVIAGLEVAGWSLKRLRKSPALEIATVAAKEAQRIAARYHATEIPAALSIARRPEILGTLLSLAPRLVPFNLEVYLAYHFSKVGDQTRQIIDDYIRLSESLVILEEDEFGEPVERLLPTHGLRALRNLLSPHR